MLHFSFVGFKFDIKSGSEFSLCVSKRIVEINFKNDISKRDRSLTENNAIFASNML